MIAIHRRTGPAVLVGDFLADVRRWGVFFLGWALVCLFMLAGGCARLPDYARPQFHVPPSGAAISGDSFGYRQLTVDDFRAPDLPPAYDRHHHRINAHSCISIRPAEETKGRISQGIYAGQRVFVGSVPQVRFEAVFVPACSWWSPDIAAERQTYVLEHEQIHFALAELTARRLTIEARRELEEFLVVDSSRQAVQEALADKVKALTRDAMEASFEEHMDFDEETSLTYDPAAQRRWLKEVRERLAENTAPVTAMPAAP